MRARMLCAAAVPTLLAIVLTPVSTAHAAEQEVSVSGEFTCAGDFFGSSWRPADGTGEALLSLEAPSASPAGEDIPVSVSFVGGTEDLLLNGPVTLRSARVAPSVVLSVSDGAGSLLEAQGSGLAGQPVDIPGLAPVVVDSSTVVQVDTEPGDFGRTFDIAVASIGFVVAEGGPDAEGASVTCRASDPTASVAVVLGEPLPEPEPSPEVTDDPTPPAPTDGPAQPDETGESGAAPAESGATLPASGASTVALPGVGMLLLLAGGLVLVRSWRLQRRLAGHRFAQL